VEVRKGGTPEMAGTWANDARIAVRFAQWLDMDFAIAVDELIYKVLTKQAVVTEPFMGVYPLVIGHRAYYCYLDVLKALKLSTRSGSVAERKVRFTSQFKQCHNRNFITLDFCHYLKQLSTVRQLELEFTLAKGGRV
ncbi:MAG: KilA-N domain-containing protein, partial [Pseudomonas sp.]|nr:KilA-N domain-containing protein [Pseudomonas sp.]